MTHHITDEQIVAATWRIKREDFADGHAYDLAIARAVLALAAPAQQGEPFGYFRALPFGWEQCAEGDEGAVALYAAPAPAVPGWWREVIEKMVNGIDHLAELARQWEPDHSSGADRRGWVLAKNARDEAVDMLTAAPTPPAQSEPVQLGELAKRNIYDAIRGAYDLGYNDARNARAVPGDSAPGYEGRNVEADHGGALLNSLNQRLRNAPAQPAVPEDVARARAALTIATDALDEIALAGMSGTGQESEEAMRDWHARRAREFIGIAARGREAARAAEKGGA